MEHLGTIELYTERLTLRRLTINDVNKVFNNWTSDSEVSKFLPWPTHENIDVTKTVLENWIEKYPQKDFYQWAIIFNEINEPIGTITVVGKNDRTKMVEIGYCIGKKWWNKGITSEALASVIKFLFENVGVNRIQAFHDSRNVYSGKVMEKCGMKLEGKLKQSGLNNSGICDHCLYGIVAEDYFEKKLEKQKTST